MLAGTASSSTPEEDAVAPLGVSCDGGEKPVELSLSACDRRVGAFFSVGVGMEFLRKAAGFGATMGGGSFARPSLLEDRADTGVGGMSGD